MAYYEILHSALVKAQYQLQGEFYLLDKLCGRFKFAYGVPEVGIAVYHDISSLFGTDIQHIAVEFVGFLSGGLFAVTNVGYVQLHSFSVFTAGYADLPDVVGIVT